MTDIDIVEILRQKARGEKNSVGDFWGDLYLTKAAAEIDSLRAQNKRLMSRGIEDMKHEIESLRAEVETYSRDVMWVCFGCGHEFAESEYEAAAEHFGMAGEKPAPACVADRDRLREAVERECDVIVTQSIDDFRAFDIRRRLQAALNREETCETD